MQSCRVKLSTVQGLYFSKHNYSILNHGKAKGGGGGGAFNQSPELPENPNINSKDIGLGLSSLLVLQWDF